MHDEQRKWIYRAIPLVVVIGLGAALYYSRTHQPAVEPAAVRTETPPASVAPPIKHPLSEAPDQQKPLPTLSDSDAAVQESLAGVFGSTLEPFLVPSNVIRNVVVTIDNLPRKKTAVQRLPLKPTPGDFVAHDAEELTLSEANFARYAPLVNRVRNADVAQASALYRRFYPLFQQAYVDLGYPEGYFNDRLVEVLDHLLATPAVPGPIRLTHPSMHYEFADATLEERSAGQKLLIRMGPGNAAALKAKLRELRDAVANQDGSPGRG